MNANSMVPLPPPLRARTPEWLCRSIVLLTGPADVWSHECGIAVISATELVEISPHGSGIVAPHYHVSATHREIVGPRLVRRSCTDQEMEQVRAVFGLGGAEEDNHGEGIARHLRIVCGREVEPECQCKQDATKIVEGTRIRFEEQP